MPYLKLTPKSEGHALQRIVVYKNTENDAFGEVGETSASLTSLNSEYPANFHGIHGQLGEIQYFEKNHPWP